MHDQDDDQKIVLVIHIFVHVCKQELEVWVACMNKYIASTLGPGEKENHNNSVNVSYS